MGQNDIYDLIIIGGGPGGLTAGIYAMRAALKTVLIEVGLPGGQMNNSDSVENWPGNEHIGGAELAIKFAQHAKSYGLEVITEEVVELEPGLDFHTVKLASGDSLQAHAVILATGGHPRKLNIPGEEEQYGQGVSYCAVCDGFFFRDKTVVVVGGGDTAAEESLYLAKLAKANFAGDADTLALAAGERIGAFVSVCLKVRRAPVTAAPARVFIGPGEMALTRMPCLPTSPLIAAVSACSPALLAAYAALLGGIILPPIEEMFTIAPPSPKCAIAFLRISRFCCSASSSWAKGTASMNSSISPTPPRRCWWVRSTSPIIRPLAVSWGAAQTALPSMRVSSRRPWKPTPSLTPEQSRFSTPTAIS